MVGINDCTNNEELVNMMGQECGNKSMRVARE